MIKLDTSDKQNKIVVSVQFMLELTYNCDYKDRNKIHYRYYLGIDTGISFRKIYCLETGIRTKDKKRYHVYISHDGTKNM